ncbi:hypothetical protein V8E51_013146 [Hyaloscypha variabilis]
MEDSNYVGHPMDLRMYSVGPRIIGIIPYRQFSQNNDFEEGAVTDITTAAITFKEKMSENTGLNGARNRARARARILLRASANYPGSITALMESALRGVIDPMFANNLPGVTVWGAARAGALAAAAAGGWCMLQMGEQNLFRKASELQSIENLLASIEWKACVEAKLMPVTRDRKQIGMRKKDTIRGKFESGREEEGFYLGMEQKTDSHEWHENGKMFGR